MASSSEEEMVNEMLKKLLDEMEPLPGRISKLLQHHRGRRDTAASDDPTLRTLDFILDELGGVVESLRQPGPGYAQDSDFYRWLHMLSSLATDISSYLQKAEQADLCGCHTQIHRAAAYCCLRAAGLPLPFPHGVEGIEKRLCEDAERPCRYRQLLLHDGGVSTSTASSLCAELPGGISHLVGIENAMRNKLVKWFMDDDKDLKVISFVGPAGVGKTALASKILYRKIQNEPRCPTAVVNVCQKPGSNKRDRLLRDLLSQIQPPESTTNEDHEEDLAERINQYLQDKRYIVLIDDIWKESDWQMIKTALPRNNQGSRIMVTTSITRVAEECLKIDGQRMGYVHKVNPLSQADSKKLLFRKAFDSESSCPDRLKHVCEQVLMRCGGIPLFLCGMADWLKQQQQEEQSVRHLPQKLEAFEQSLSAAYDDLPYRFKVQFLYVSMFPHGYLFEKNSFSKRLVAEWLVDSGSSTDEYFQELINRNVITPAANSKLSPVEDSHWQLNYFMHQFLANKSAETGFLWTSASLISSSSPLSEKRAMSSLLKKGCNRPRRLSLHLIDSETQERLPDKDLRHTRSLAVSGVMGEIHLDKFVCLMVLDLEGWKCFKDEYLLVICKMFLLRYLSLRKTSAEKLPPNIRDLLKLQTLDLSHTKITELPCQVSELPELRMLDIRGTPVKQLPAQIRKMRQLRDLFFGVNGVDLREIVTEVPVEIRYLEVLRTIETIDLSRCSAAFVETLGGMGNLKVLATTWSLHQSAEEKFQTALLSAIGKWKYLESFTIYCQLGCSMDFLHFRSDRDLPVHLEKFRVTGGRFRQVPKWFSWLNDLAFIEITVCTLLKDDLSILSNLSGLECLVLGLHLLPEEGIVIDSSGFPVLRRLCVSCRVPWLIFEEEAMPALTYLELNIGGSPAKEGRVPSGISNLRSLLEVTLRYSEFYYDSPNVRATVEAVKGEVANHQRTIDLMINGTIIGV